ncbi:hypothetical protein BRC97_04255 [Halobacteriales archaeon QS_6_71_20]|nr:MAG: hypothetical protein BRC97_04255 [Halobacteriales archaeon QS_6_71_20]
MSRTTGSVTERVLERVASQSDVDVLDLPPLQAAVDPDALEMVLAGPAETRVTFTYCQRRVAVDSDGTVSLTDQPASGPGAEATASGD